MAALFRQTSETAFDRLYRQHVASVYRYVYAVLGNHADAEDVTQQTFLNAYRSMAQGTKPRKAENWLLTIAHNEIRRHFRDNRKKTFDVEFDEQLAQPTPERGDPSLADVLRALQQIPPAQRSALVMREFEGRSYAEIAEIMDVTPKALETLIFRARRSLAEQLEGSLTCTEAEEAFLRRLDGRLPRREARRLKAHVGECLPCARFGRVQRQQRSLLKGLSIMPVPASLFLFRGEVAAAAGGTASAGAGGAAAGAGATGIATGLLAKAAAVGAAAAVAGGVGYEVATAPDTVAKAERNVTQASAAAKRLADQRAARVEPRVVVARSLPARSTSGPASRKAVGGKALRTKLRRAGKALGKPASAASVASERAKEKAVRPAKTRGVKSKPLKVHRLAPRRVKPKPKAVAKPHPANIRPQPKVAKPIVPDRLRPAQALTKPARGTDAPPEPGAAADPEAKKRDLPPAP
jgi:RNA polymerase sigma factor (sigma-70 family)